MGRMCRAPRCRCGTWAICFETAADIRAGLIHGNELHDPTMATLTQLLDEVDNRIAADAAHRIENVNGHIHGVVTGGEWLTAENHGARLAASDLTLTPNYDFNAGPYRGTLIGTSSWSRGRTSRPMRYTRSGDYLYLVERNIQPEGSVFPIVLSPVFAGGRSGCCPAVAFGIQCQYDG